MKHEMKFFVLGFCLLIGFTALAENRPSDNQLIQAAANGDLSGVIRALNAGANINAMDPKYEWTALGAAVGLGKTDVAKYLLDKGAVIGKTVLMSAACWGRMELMDLLIKHGADINATNKSGMTALMLAASNIEAEQISAVKYLLDHGAKVNAKDNEGSTALMMAAPMGRDAVVKLLLDHGADPNARPFGRNGLSLESPALIGVAESGRLETAKLLLSKGADPNIRGDDGNYLGVTPLIIASQYGHTNLIKILLDNGADINAKRNDGVRGETSLVWALEYNQDSMAEFLITNGAAPNLADANGNTALIYAVSGKKLQLAKLLLARGAEVNAVNSYGMSALTLAVEVGDAKTVKLLLENGAKADAKLTTNVPIMTPHGSMSVTNGTSILTIAKLTGDTNILFLLQSAGVKN